MRRRIEGYRSNLNATPLRKSLLLLLILLVLGGGILFIRFVLFYQQIYRPSMEKVQISSPARLIQQEQKPTLGPSLINLHMKPMTLLLVGIDSRKGDTQSRSDSIVVAVVNPTTHKINFIPIPRDTYTNVPGYGFTKINHAMFYGGIGLLKETVSEFLHVQIDQYAVLDFQGFVKVVNDLGGITVPVEKDMDYEDPTDQTAIHLKKGLHLLTGEEALGYARFRHDEEADTGRIRRQQILIKLLMNEMKGVHHLGKLFQILTDVQTHLQTDVAPITLVKILQTYHDNSSQPLETLTIDGVNEVLPDDQLWYFFVKKEERLRISNLVKDLLREESYAWQER